MIENGIKMVMDGRMDRQTDGHLTQIFEQRYTMIPRTF